MAEPSSLHRSLGIIPCSKEKIWDQNPQLQGVLAKDAYRSAFHRYARLYAEKHCDAHIIFSAKYGLIEPDAIIEGPYDVTFSRPEDPCISEEELRRQAQQYACYEAIVIICPMAYARILELAFAQSSAQLLYPLRNVGGFGHMHRFLKERI